MAQGHLQQDGCRVKYTLCFSFNATTIPTSNLKFCKKTYHKNLYETVHVINFKNGGAAMV
jgi:hypothetical protein